MSRAGWRWLAAIGLVACVALLDAGISSQAAEPVAGSGPGVADATVPEWLRGVWTREWIDEGGTKSNPRAVIYLQTPTVFADMRIPVDRPSFAGVQSLDALTDVQLAALMKQDGWVGTTSVRGDIASWPHELSYQPKDGSSDEGRLERRAADSMYEHGLDGSYTEAWRRATDGAGRFLVLRVERGGRPSRVLVVVGDYFLYARNRAKDLPGAASLEELVKTTRASRAEVLEYLDCEFSSGRIAGGAGPWRIERSTLPWREGQRLDFVDEITVSKAPGGLQPRRSSDEHWRVVTSTLSSAEVLAMFGSRVELTPPGQH